MSCRECDINCVKYRSWDSKANRDNGNLPSGHAVPEIILIEKGVIGIEENDSLLIRYIINNLEEIDDVCYFDIAYEIACNIEPNTIHTSYIFSYMIDYLYIYYGNPEDENNAIRERLFEIKFNKIKRENKCKRVTVNQRTGQQQLKKQLLSLYGKCRICGLENDKLLIASHIKPFKDSTINESYDVENAMLLCKLHDGLFDAGLISFDNDGQVMISDKLTKNDRKIMGLDENIHIKLRGIDLKQLKWHRDHIFK